MDTWGALPKSQVDAQTILEAVAALITAHNDDPDSHLDVGQSLQSHKASEIIDHLAYSVVRDKITFDRFSIDCDFQTIDTWTSSALVELSNINTLAVYTDTGVGETAHAYLNTGELSAEYTYWANSPNWQATVAMSDVSAGIGKAGIFDDTYNDGAGFYFSASKLYALWHDEAGDEQTYEIVATTDGTAYNLRMSYDNDTTTLSFFVNGSLVHDVVVVEDANVSRFCNFYNENVTSSGSYFFAANFHFDCNKP